MGVSILIITMLISILEMCIGMVVSSLISLYINTYYTGKLIHVTLWVQLKDLCPSLAYSLSMGALVYIFVNLLPNVWLQLIWGVLLGVGYYYAFSKITKSDDLEYLKEVIDTNILSRMCNHAKGS